MYKPWSVPERPLFLGLYHLSQPSLPWVLSPLLSTPLFPATSQPFPRLGGRAPKASLASLAVSLCLTGSRLRRALRLLLTSTQLLQEEEGRAARGWIRDSRFGVCS